VTRAVPSVRVGRDAVVAAPSSGVLLGVNDAGPVALRLFRLLGTRVSVAGLIEAAQLLTVRAAAAGTPVQVMTARPHVWEPLVRFSSASRVVHDEQALQPHGGPSLLVDDRPGQRHSGGERVPWQCVVDVRGQWTADEVAGLGYSDLTVFGSVPVQQLSAVASVFALPPHEADPLAHVPPGSVALVRRGTVVPVTLNPSAAEYRVIEATRTQAAPPAWRG